MYGKDYIMVCDYMKQVFNIYRDKKVLAVGIYYNSDSKEHQCKIEEI